MRSTRSVTRTGQTRKRWLVRRPELSLRRPSRVSSAIHEDLRRSLTPLGHLEASALSTDDGLAEAVVFDGAALFCASFLVEVDDDATFFFFLFTAYG